MIRGSADIGFLLVGGRSILGTRTNLDHKIEAITEETTVLGSSWQLNEPVGVKRVTLTQQGFYDDAANSVNEAMGNATNPGSTAVLSYAFNGNTTGQEFIGWQGGLLTNYEVAMSRDQLHKANAEYVNGPNAVVEVGRIVWPLGGVTSSGQSTGAPLDFGASNTSGAAAYLQITSLTGHSATGIEIEIMHSSDNITYSSWGGFTQTTAFPSAERINSTAKLERYVAVRRRAGTGFGTSAIFFVGVARK